MDMGKPYTSDMAGILFVLQVNAAQKHAAIMELQKNIDKNKRQYVLKVYIIL